MGPGRRERGKPHAREPVAANLATGACWAERGWPVGGKAASSRPSLTLRMNRTLKQHCKGSVYGEGELNGRELKGLASETGGVGRDGEHGSAGRGDNGRRRNVGHGLRAAASAA
jgi:hypothetical protein